jgi:flagellar motor switch protein FliG
MMAGFDENGTLDAAVLLLALGEETAAEVFKQLTPKEVQSIGEVMARTQFTTKEHVNRVLERFHERAAAQSTLVDDSNAYVRDVLRRALGEEKAGMLIDRITQGSDVTGIESLRWMDASSIAELVRGEHPQIIASILVHLERDQASAILLQLSEELRADVVLRIATLDGIQPNALKELNEALSLLLAGGEQVKRTRLGGSKTAAEIINFLGGTADVALLDAIRSEDPDLAQAIEDQMFTFDDLINLDDKSIQVLLREIQSEDLVIALKGADAPLREKIFKNMSQRAAETMREDLEDRGPVKLSEVEAQHKEILKTVRRLADAGQIAVGGGGGDEFV